MNALIDRLEKLAVTAQSKEACLAYDHAASLARSMRAKAAKPEPMPKTGRFEVLPAVIADLNARSIMGKEKYGTVLKTDNGRNALMDAYQESLDLAMYLKQELMERGIA